MVSEACLSGNKDCARGEWCQKHVCLVTRTVPMVSEAWSGNKEWGMVSEACLSGNKDCAHGEWCQKHVCLVTRTVPMGNGVRSMSVW